LRAVKSVVAFRSCRLSDGPSKIVVAKLIECGCGSIVSGVTVKHGLLS
jgi:hypothetical protein